MKTFSTVNPFTQKKIKSYSFCSDGQLGQKIQSASKIQNKWASLSIEERRDYLLLVKKYIQENLESMSKQATLEMGKRFAESQAELKKVLQIFDFLNDPQTIQHVQPREIKTTTKMVKVHYRPMGTLFIIMPWNFPYWQVYRMALPNLLMGNSVLLKHSQITAGAAQWIEKSFHKSLPPEFRMIFQNLIITHAQSTKVIAHHSVQGVSLTGSAIAGKSIGEQAGRQVKKSVLELGGADPYLVLPDADIERAAKICAEARLINNGQSCVAAKRFIVHESIYSEFMKCFVEAFDRFNLGDPLRLTTGLGPLAHLNFALDVEKKIKSYNRKKAWTQVYQQSSDLSYKDGFCASSVYQVKNVEAFFYEEFFAPVSLVYKAKNLSQMLKYANASAFGLGAAVFTNDESLFSKQIAPHLQAGIVAYNDMVRSDVFAPFGGVKESGYGRELSLWGLTEFAYTQSVG